MHFPLPAVTQRLILTRLEISFKGDTRDGLLQTFRDAMELSNVTEANRTSLSEVLKGLEEGQNIFQLMAACPAFCEPVRFLLKSRALTGYGYEAGFHFVSQFVED